VKTEGGVDAWWAREGERGSGLDGEKYLKVGLMVI
jgi:hypothetical protein